MKNGVTRRWPIALSRLPISTSRKVERKGEGALAGKGRGKQPLVPAGQARRPGDGQRFRSLRNELRVEHKKRNAGEMVAMEMREQDELDGIAVDAALLERHQRGGAAIDQGIGVRAVEMEAGIEPSAGPEGVARADELQPHVNSNGSGHRARHSQRLKPETARKPLPGSRQDERNSRRKGG